MSDFFKLYEDPRWQKKRLLIMERDQYTCLLCNRNDKKLNVHHAYYESGMAPWEYPDQSLHTLCDRCHAEAEAIRTSIKKQAGCLSLHDQHLVHGYIHGLRMKSDEAHEFRPGPIEEIWGVADAARCNFQDLIPIEGPLTQAILQDVGAPINA